MTKPLSKRNNPEVAVLLAGSADDHGRLAQILAHSQWPLCPDARWRLKACPSLPCSVKVLKKSKIAIVLCDCDLGEGVWIQMLEELRRLPVEPFLIVTSRLADDHLWAEALNLGAYDVLAKPFDPNEVVRILSLACLRWRGRSGRPSSRSRNANA